MPRTFIVSCQVDSHRPGKPEADSVRSRLEEAKGEVEALLYAEERAAGNLDRLPREHKDDWLTAATRSLHKARDAYTAAIVELARTRDQLADEAVLVTFLRYDGQHAEPIGGAIKHTTQEGIVQWFGIDQLTELMLAEAAGVEEKTGLDPTGHSLKPPFT